MGSAIAGPPLAVVGPCPRWARLARDCASSGHLDGGLGAGPIPVASSSELLMMFARAHAQPQHAPWPMPHSLHASRTPAPHAQQRCGLVMGGGVPGGGGVVAAACAAATAVTPAATHGLKAGSRYRVKPSLHVTPTIGVKGVGELRAEP